MPVITLVCEGDFPHAHVGKLLKKSVKKVSQIVDFSFAL